MLKFILINLLVYGEHSDIIETIEKELNIIAQYHDQLEVLEKYFYYNITLTLLSKPDIIIL